MFDANMASMRGRWSQVSGGGLAGGKQKPKPIALEYGEAGAVDFYQDAAREGVGAMGRQSAGDFRKAIGGYLGNLNGIGALRSGAVQTGADDIMDTYSRNFANQASQATLGAIGYGQNAAEAVYGRQEAAAERKARNKAAKIGAVGQLLGAGVGLLGGRKKP